MTIQTVSPNGKRLPLRAMSWRDLNREFWSQGKVVYADSLERSRARELTAHEKPVVEPITRRNPDTLQIELVERRSTNCMTLDELIATQDREPLSESRRSWLERGQGTLSLSGLNWDSFNDGSIGATLVDTEAQAILEAVVDRAEWIELSEPDAAPMAIENDARRYGTPYETLDPITAKQIDWEQRVHGDGPVIRTKLVPSPSGGIAIRTDRKLMPEDFLKLARSVKRTLLDAFGTCLTLDDLHARVDLMSDALASSGVTIDVTSPDPTEERERFLALADAEWHSSYERPQPVIAILSNTPAERPCPRRACTTIEEHRHERITRLVHRSAMRSTDEFWHTKLFDITAFELGTDGLVDPLVSF